MTNILIVDDVLMNIKVIELKVKMWFKRNNLSDSFNLYKATNGKKAIESVQNNHIQIIFLDVMMPVMDGLEAMKIIRNMNNLENQPIICIVTALNEKDVLKDLSNQGANSVMEKPIKNGELEAFLKKSIIHE